MNLKTMKIPLIIIIGALAFALGASPARCEDAALPPAGGVPSQSVQEKVEQWRRLRDENPEAFRRLAEKRKQRIHQKVSEYREKNPEKFEAFKKNVIQRRHERLLKLREQNPGEFQREMGGRAQKFREWKREHPEKFQEFKRNHPRAAERTQPREEIRVQRQSLPGFSGKNARRKDSREAVRRRRRS